ncbi:MAG: putative rane protein, partial [Ramlibacter sp.]|nr:putative rane protein [Ramlibacter sp.]
MDYVFLKWIHVLSSTILFGAGVGSAFHLFAATLRRQVGGIAMATRNVVLADWLLTTTTAVLQPVSGLALVHMLNLPYSTPWVAWSLGLYVVAIACWVPVVVIQIRMRNVMADAHRTGARVPAAYDRM